MSEQGGFWSRLVVREDKLRPVTAGADSRLGRPRIVGWGDLVGREGGGIVVLVVLFGALALASEAFLTVGNMGNLSRQFTVYGIIAIGELLVILTRGIDLSVGSVVGLSGAIAAELMVSGLPIPVAVLGALGTGLAVGLINGALVAYAKLPAFIVTLGMLGAARGLVLLITDAKTIQPLPEGFSSIANATFLGLPNMFWIAVLLTAAIGLMLRRTVWGRYIYATGSNLESARLSGVPVRKVQLSVFALSGLLAGVAGMLLASRLDAGVPTAGETYELDAIAACVIGGASLFGAKGSAIGAAIGAMITSTLNNGGNLLEVNSFYLRIAIGVLIILAISFDQFQTRVLQRSKAPPG
ncbi:monosaccharide ABC transporter membrane protein (CUT2 family) [Tamaricihabitans halophyticus]|uniref:Monosaccharide ABC transporter membrane protein (CUT2 family) n=1 Tax=Tamaricihabitans halophyticus TaxID=1262583 RepID=A0A4R2QKI9_9PSEU|nr:ABC transporter permease [Tamaricihabitans halophyticus]TCP49369.1 monosaccharide ABC transporter membrane protein (CUT2 family) [Tamaricihabitans halophyticus]